MLTAMMIAIEVLAATSGEALIGLTILSTLLIYMICRRSIASGIVSYITAGVILLLINPHQWVFFAFVNGLLGMSLGVCDRKTGIAAISIFISGLALFLGMLATVIIIGFFAVNGYIGILMLILSFIYAALYRFAARKVYEKLNKVEMMIK